MSWIGVVLAMVIAWGAPSYAVAEDAWPSFRVEAQDGREYDFFGDAVAMTGDTMVVGTWGKSDMGRNAGAAYVFVRMEEGWRQTVKLTPSDATPEQRFGHAVAVHGDTLVVGAVHDGERGMRAGAAYVFTRVSGTWIETAKLVASDAGEYQEFGASVSVAEDVIVVGAPGHSATAAYVYQRTDGGIWKERAKLTPPEPADGLSFGIAVDASRDLVVVGGKRDVHRDSLVRASGGAYVFERVDGRWTAGITLAVPAGISPSFGSAISLSGDWIAVGAPEEGSVHLYARSVPGWRAAASFTPRDVERPGAFGASVDLAGSLLVVGAPGDDHAARRAGAAYVYALRGDGWAEVTKIVSRDIAEDQRFGRAVAVGTMEIAFGAAGDQLHGRATGAAYVYTCPDTADVPKMDGRDQARTGAEDPGVSTADAASR